MHTFVQTVMYRVVIPRFQKGHYDLGVQANVFPPEFVATMRRPRRPLEVRESAAHFISISLEHISQDLATANIDHGMCEAIEGIRSVCISSRAVNNSFVAEVYNKIVRRGLRT